ncbi:hypothetical protein R6Z07F_019868 [Ovis aries]
MPRHPSFTLLTHSSATDRRSSRRQQHPGAGTLSYPAAGDLEAPEEAKGSTQGPRADIASFRTPKPEVAHPAGPGCDQHESWRGRRRSRESRRTGSSQAPSAGLTERVKAGSPSP